MFLHSWHHSSRMATSRRTAMKQLTMAGAGLAMMRTAIWGRQSTVTVAGRPVEIVVQAISPSTVRVRVLPIVNGRPHRYAWCSKESHSTSS